MSYQNTRERGEQLFQTVQRSVKQQHGYQDLNSIAERALPINLNFII